MRGEVDTKSAAHVNPTLFMLGQKPKACLGHEVGGGSRCLKCDCPGLDLHFWRKICKNCSHKMDDHDVVTPEEDHGQLIIGRLFDIIPAFESKAALSVAGSSISSAPEKAKFKRSAPTAQFNVKMEAVGGAAATGATAIKGAEAKGVEKDTEVEYTWIPTGDRNLAEKYFQSIPEEERPISGTPGALDRRQKLQYQLPYHDSNAAAARSIKTDQDRELHTKFVTIIKEKVVGVGQLIEWTESVRRLSTASMEDGAKSDARHAVYGCCRACNESLKPGDVAVVTDHGAPNEIWHPNCFRCFTCQQRLVDMLYFFKDGEYYCGRHFGDTMYPRCAGCDELIFSKEYTFAESKNWHFDHFCCFGCDKQLGGHRYMVRDEQPFCFDCYMNKFARSCQACRNKIAPDQQRISYKELHWHAEGRCFQCKECHKVLLNQKFIIKNEEVFCSSTCKNAHFA